MKSWSDLTDPQKTQFTDLCNDQYGNSFTKSQDGEPLYFDQNANLIDTSIIYNLLFDLTLN